jgi:glycosyltransferase involved in cell wall biosynthesis
MKQNQSRILLILHLPPPVHGASMVGEYIKNSHLINTVYDCRYVNLASSKNLTEIGRFSLRKILQIISLLIRIFIQVIRFNPSLVYVTANAQGVAFYRDFLIVQLLKLLRCKVVIHYHNKGVSSRSDKKFDDFLYRRFFKNVYVILLAETLYNDIKKYVSKDRIFICPNGIPD